MTLYLLVRVYAISTTTFSDGDADKTWFEFVQNIASGEATVSELFYITGISTGEPLFIQE